MLDAYFKSYFGTFVLAALFGGSLLTAKIANVFIERALQPPVSELHKDTRRVRRSVRGAQQRASPSLDAFLARNLFGAENEDLMAAEKARAEREAAAAPPTEQTSVDQGACESDRCNTSAVPANLLATVWTGDGASSQAVFQATSGGEIEVVQVGDQLLKQATVTSIYRNRVCVSRAGTCEMFSLDQTKKRVQTPRPSRPVAAVKPKGPQLGAGVRKMGDKEYEIEKSEIDSVLSNLNTIARQARIVPSFKNGKSNGFKLFSIRPNSLYSKIGIQNGDIVQKINGYEINSPDKALEIYSKLRDADSITVDLVRRGQPVTMSYTIR